VTFKVDRRPRACRVTADEIELTASAVIQANRGLAVF